MNSFEADLKRAIISPLFIVGVSVMLYIVNKMSINSDLFKISVPIIASMPYSTAWLKDKRSGYIKLYLVRINETSYILGKIMACAISSGLVIALPIWIYDNYMAEMKTESAYIIFFLVGALWGCISAVLAVWTNNSCVAYGGAFVVCYLLIILCERYLQNMYCIYPYEWMFPKKQWVFEESGRRLVLVGFIAVVMCIYYEMVRRKIKDV